MMDPSSSGNAYCSAYGANPNDYAMAAFPDSTNPMDYFVRYPTSVSSLSLSSPLLNSAQIANSREKHKRGKAVCVCVVT